MLAGQRAERTLDPDYESSLARSPQNRTGAVTRAGPIPRTPCGTTGGAAPSWSSHSRPGWARLRRLPPQQQPPPPQGYGYPGQPGSGQEDEQNLNVLSICHFIYAGLVGMVALVLGAWGLGAFKNDPAHEWIIKK